MTAEPNVALQSARAALNMSQDELAAAIRAVGDRTGEPNGCSKRDIQRWESGHVKRPRGDYIRALEMITGQPGPNLGFGGSYRPGRRDVLILGAAAALPLPEVHTGPTGGFEGIWRSQYQYESSSRGGKWYTCSHYCVVLHRGARLQVRSLPETAKGKITLDMTVKGNVVTGTWNEQTDQDGYYSGAVYYGAIQMLVDPTGHRMTGKWVGFGRDGDVNVGPWQLTRETSDTSKSAMEAWNKPAADKTPDGDDVPDGGAPDEAQAAG